MRDPTSHSAGGHTSRHKGKPKMPNWRKCQKIVVSLSLLIQSKVEDSVLRIVHAASVLTLALNQILRSMFDYFKFDF